MDTPPDGTRIARAASGEVWVAVIDDEPIHCRTVRRLLQASGLRVRMFGTVTNALDSGALFDCRVLIIDVLLGEECGIDGCAQVRELGYDGGIVMLSGMGDLVTKSRALDAGADAYLVKPVAGIELRAQIRALLRRVSRAFRPVPARPKEEPVSFQVAMSKLKPVRRRLLKLFAVANGQPVDRNTLKSKGLDNPQASDDALEKHIKLMRLVLAPLGIRIETVSGIGYRCPTSFVFD